MPFGTCAGQGEVLHLPVPPLPYLQNGWHLSERKHPPDVSTWWPTSGAPEGPGDLRDSSCPLLRGPAP